MKCFKRLWKSSVDPIYEHSVRNVYLDLSHNTIFFCRTDDYCPWKSEGKVFRRGEEGNHGGLWPCRKCEGHFVVRNSWIHRQAFKDTLNGSRDQGPLHLGPGPLPRFWLGPGTKASRYCIGTRDHPLKFERDQGSSHKKWLRPETIDTFHSESPLYYTA